MAITVTEMHDSRSRKTDGIVLHYRIDGTADDGDAADALLDEAPETFDIYERQSYQITPKQVDATAGTGIWEAEVDYVLVGKKRPETGDSEYSFDTGGGTQHIDTSLATISSYDRIGSDIPDFENAINFDGQNVNGVDIVVPQYNWSETHYIADASVTGTYKGKLFELTGKVNDATFKGFDAGECLFLGARGSKRAEGDWQITFSFSSLPNRTDITIGGIPAVGTISKKGWEYLWVFFQHQVDPDAKVLCKVPAYAYVEKVYEDGDFSDLGIGTT